MALPSPFRLAGTAAGAALQLTATAAGVAAFSAAAGASLLAGSARVGTRAVRTVSSTTATAVVGCTRAATTVAAGGVRVAGTALTGSDPLGEDGLGRFTRAARGMFEPPEARCTRRVWASGGHAHLELPAPAVHGGPELRTALYRHLERLEGVDWAAVNEVVGRVLVAFDHRRISVDELVGVVTAIEQARGGRRVFPQRAEHPADLEPVIAAAVTLLIDSAAAGVAFTGKVLPVPALTRHATAVLALLDTQPRVAQALADRIGPVGTDLAFTGLSALLHMLTQNPTVPALNAAADAQRLLEVYARRRVWRRREPELCGPFPDDAVVEAWSAPGQRPVELPPGPIESYRARLAPLTLAGSLGLLVLTRRPSRSADALKAVSSKAAGQGRETFAAVLDLLLCRRGVLPMDGSAYRRLDRIDAVVLDSDVLCSGPPVLVDARACAPKWDNGAVWAAASRLLDGGNDSDERGGLRLTSPERSADPPGGEVRRLVDRDEVVGTVTVAPELDPHAEALLKAVNSAGHRLVLTEHAGTREIASLVNEVAGEAEPLAETVRRLQSEGHGVLAVSAADSPGLLAADIGVAVTRSDRPPAWGADLLTPPGLGDVWRLVTATTSARALSQRVVNTARTGNVLGGLLAAVGNPRSGQRKATTPGKTATALTMALGTWTALRLDAAPPPPPSMHTPWHALEAEQVLRRLAELPGGPAEQSNPWAAVSRQLTGFPLVRLPVRFARTVAAELSDPLTPVLGTGAVATAMLGDPFDAVLVGGVMVGNALLSGFQRLRAETTLESLLLEQEVVAHQETADGPRDVPARQLRVGDRVLLGSGDVVPADARLLEARDLEVDESSLTGESLSVAKAVPATPGAELADRTCMVFDGTTVVAGSGRAVVVAVGEATQAGRAAAAAASAPPPAGVQARLAELTRAVLPVTLAGGAAVTALGVLWRRPLREAVAAGVAVAVAAVPEGLPLVATVAQLAAARRLSRRGAVVRSARVLEALGRADTVCIDKTGTLTENRLSVVRLVPLGDEYGAREGEQAERELLRLAVAAAGAADERVHETDRAVAEAAAARGVLPEQEPGATLPFAGDRGFSAAVRDGRLLVKGAPEVVLDRCADSADGRRSVRSLAAEGLRVLAVADGAASELPADLDEAAHGLTLRGFVALADTVRPSAETAVQQLNAAGVRVLVVTGDHPQTASAIAAESGVPDADRVVTGAQFTEASETERARLVREAAVFARLSPEQKVSIVSALHRAGATVAMTGDGINDAAAMRLADVGIVAGAESHAARSSADLVLTDIDLTRLVDAIGEGRAMWSRVRDAVSVLVGGNAGEVAFTVLGTAFGGRAPIGTRQLLLVNMLTDMFPALAVAVAGPGQPSAGDGKLSSGPLAGHSLEPVLLAGPYRGFASSVKQMVLIRGVATAAGATGAWAVGRITGTRARAGTMGLAALIATQLGQTALAGRRSPLVLATAAGSFIALVAVVQTPGVSQFFGCRPLGPLAWLQVVGWAAAGTVGAEVLPPLTRRWLAGAAAAKGRAGLEAQADQSSRSTTAGRAGSSTRTRTSALDRGATSRA